MPVEAPNTLRSRARYKIIDVLSEGPIKGLVNGAKSIYFDDTPVQNEDGTFNFPNFSPSSDIQQLPVAAVDGVITPQRATLFPASENTVNVGVKITKDNPEGTGSGDGSATRTITDADLDAVRVTMRVPALSTTNLTTGDITGGKIRFQIYVKPDGGEFAPTNTGLSWKDLATPESETGDGATGIEITASILGNRTIAQQIYWQYAKKTGETWGDWVTFTAHSVPAISAAQGTVGFYQWPVGFTEVYTKSITGLAPGIYKARIVTVGSTSVTTTLAREYSGNFIEISGKTVSPYDASYLVNLPNGGAPWDIKVVRISDDNTGSQFQDDLYWLSYTELIDNRFSWPNIAGIRVSMDAETFGGNVPNRAYDVMGLMIEIPSNYDPYNRTYTGVWDGTFKTDWTDNPAWIFYNLLTNKRWGLGNNIPAAQVDKWGLYTIAQYCDELVDAPNGFQEPRYTCSCVINSQQEAYELLTAIASAFRGMMYWSNGAITATADMPTDTLINVGPANVIDGEFTYQGASRKSRHSVARVSWNNPDDGYKLNVEIYEDDEAIRKYGYRPIDINAIGCTSRGLARRWGKWQVASDNNVPDTVTYKASFDHFMTQGKAVRPGDVVAIADPNYSAEQNFGRIVSIVDNEDTTHTITLDRDVTLIGGDDSELQLTLADGDTLDLDVSVVSTVTDSEITIASALLTETPLSGATWLLKKETVEPRLWRVFSVTEPEPHIYQVSAMLYDPNKYDSIETGLNFDEAQFSAMPTGEMPAPTGVLHSEFLKQTGSAILACVNLSWTRPNDARADLFEVQYQVDGEDWRATEPNLTSSTSIDIFNIIPETYNFRVRAQDTTGLFRSAWTTYASKELYGKNKKPEDVTNFTAVIEKYGVLMNWSPVSDIDINYYEIRRGASWAAGTFVGRAKGTTHKWEDATAAAYTFWIKAFDTNGNESVNAASVSASVVVEATPSVTTATIPAGIAVTIAGTLTARFAHYELQRKASTEADGEAVTVNALLASRTFSDTLVGQLGYTPLYQYRARAFDKNLNASAYSTWSTAIAPGQIESADLIDGVLSRSELFLPGVVDNAALSAEALKKPLGAVAAWNAANCTDASIATTDGVIDTSGNGNHGQAIGGVAVVDTDMGKAFQFDGTNDAITTAHTDNVFVGDADWSISAWVNVAKDGAHRVFLAKGRIAAGELIFYKDLGENLRIYADAGNLDATVSSANWVENEWQMLTAVKSGSNAYLYLNGTLKSSDVTATVNINSTKKLSIGASQQGTERFMGGMIYDLRIYNRALSATEIKSLYQNPGDVAFGRVTADLIAANAVVAGKIATDAVTSNTILANAITSGKIAAGEVKAANIAANAIEADKILAGAITADKINVTAMKAPAGAVAEWSAKGATTASIALTGGVKDVSGNGNHGQAYGGVAVVDTEMGMAFQLDGTNDYIQLVNDVGYTAQFSAIAWFRRLGAPKGGFHIIFGGAGLELDVVESTGEMLGCVVTSTKKYFTNFGSAFTNGSFHMLALSFSGSALEFYANGAKIGEITGITGTLFTSFNRTIGRLGTSDSYYANGQIAQPRIYNRALTATEIKTLYMLGSDSESGIITADRVVTGQIKSTNYSTTAGSLIDLDSGDIKMGGSTAPRFSFTNSTNSGTFAGFTFNATDMTAGATTTAIGISTDINKRAFWAGGATPTTAPFNVAHNGTGKLGGFNFYAAKLEQTGTSSLGLGNTNTTISIINTDTYSSSGPIGFYTSAVLASYPNDTWATSKMFQGQLSTSTRYGGTSSSHCDLGGMGRNGRDIYNPVMQFSMGSASWYSIATNGKIDAVGGFSSVCDERMKKNINDVAVLDKLKQIPVKAFELDEAALHRERMEQELISNLKESNKATSNSRPIDAFDIDDYDPTKHINTMAAEFNAAFGTNKKSIERVCLNDQIGVALRAIQELAEIVDDQKAEIKELRAALNLPEKEKRKKKEIERELNDEEKEILHIVEKRARKAILKRILEAENAK